MLLVFVLLFRPHEIWPVLDGIHLLDVLTGGALLGVLIEFGRGFQKDPFAPQLPFLAGLVVWCYAATAITAGASALNLATGLLFALFMLVVGYGTRTFQRLKAMIMLLLAVGTLIAGIAVHQGFSAPVCMKYELQKDGSMDLDPSASDGRSCVVTRDCAEEGDFETEWACERPGLFGSLSIGRRVRWRGQLADPNELSVFVGAVIPFLLAMGFGKDKKVRSVLVLAVIALCLTAVVLSQSRGGQLVVGTVFATYFVSRFGIVKGLIGGVLFALPVLLLGGRDVEGDSDESSAERMEIMYEGVRVALAHPLLGVGREQFREYVSLHMTAHNAYLLAFTELGLPGLYLWSGLYWITLKIPLTIVRKPPQTANPELAAVALAMVASYIAMAVGIFFLSFTYKQVLFVWFGISLGLYGVVRKDDPTFEVKVKAKDYIGIAIADIVLVTLIFVYSKMRAGGG
jgi:hypothetical protein